MAIYDYDDEASIGGRAVRRAASNTINTAQGVKRLLDDLIAVRDTGSGYPGIASTLGFTTINSANGSAAFTDIDALNAHMVNAYNVAVKFDKLRQG